MIVPNGFALEEIYVSCQNRRMKLDWHVGDVIGKVREMRDKTRAELAKDIGLSAYSMGQIEKTGKCRNTTLEKIAKALKVSIGFLYEETPNAAPLQGSIEYLCPNPIHRKLLSHLEEMLHDAQYAPWISANVVNLHAGMKGEQADLSLVVNGESQNAPRKPPKRTFTITQSSKK